MRKRIGWLVAATTSAIVLAFVLPLALLVQTVSENRAIAAGNDEARAVAILVSGLATDPQLGELVTQVDRRYPAVTSVLLADGTTLGSGPSALNEDPRVVRARTGVAFTEIDGDGGHILVPVIAGSGTAVVYTRVSSELLMSGVHRAWAGLVLLGLLLTVASLVVADRIARRISVPVTDLAQVAERLQQGDLEARAELQGPPETVELGDTMNRLAERILALLAAERAAVGDLSHRLRTPVTALRLDAESVEDEALAARLQDHVEQLQRTVDAIVRDARRPLRSTLDVGCDARDVVARRTAFWAALAEDQGRAMDVSLPDRTLRVAVEESVLCDVLDVLIDNVFAHTPEDTPFAVRLASTGEAALLLEVTDQGPGLPDDRNPPAERTGSTGLGLQIVRRVVAGAGGRVEVDSGPGAGTHVRITLPTVQGSTPA